jgi:hypothetical protein
VEREDMEREDMEREGVEREDMEREDMEREGVEREARGGRRVVAVVLLELGCELALAARTDAQGPRLGS